MTPTTTPYNSYIPLRLHEPTTTFSPLMGSSLPEFKEPISSTPPKLSLFSLPSKPSTLPDGLTPPPNTVATIPFLWEEVPGKPRPVDDPPKSKTVRSLDLPPRLITTGSTTPCHNGNGKVGIQIIPSPTTVLGGPYEGVYTSKSILRSPEKVVVNSNGGSKSKGKIRMPLRKLMRKERSQVKFSSWRWDSFKDIDGSKVDRSPSVRFCSWRWDSFRDLGTSGGSGDGGGGGLCSSFDDLQKSLDSGRKIGKVSRKNSFTFSNAKTSGFLTSVYGTVKQAMPWKSQRR